MKKEYFDYMLKIMRENKDVYLLFVGLGWPRIEEFLKEFPDRAFNTEASEQTALDIAVGLAYAGKTPWVYTITPFFLRGWETIRTYINHEKLNINLVGAGVNDDYSKHDGFSHDATDMPEFFGVLNNFEVYIPKDLVELEQNMNMMMSLKRPSFLNIRR